MKPEVTDVIPEVKAVQAELQIQSACDHIEFRRTGVEDVFGSPIKGFLPERINVTTI